MTDQVSIDEAQSRLKELIFRLAPGEELIITENQRPIAKLVSEEVTTVRQTRPGPGACSGAITYIAPDFDAPLDDMQEYME